MIRSSIGMLDEHAAGRSPGTARSERQHEDKTSAISIASSAGRCSVASITLGRAARACREAAAHAARAATERSENSVQMPPTSIAPTPR